MAYFRETSIAFFWVCGYNKLNKFNEGNLVFADVDVNHRADSIADSPCELHFTMGDDIVWQSVSVQHMFEQHSCLFWWVGILSTAYVDRHLCYSIDYDHDDSVFTLRWPSGRSEIDSTLNPSHGWCGGSSCMDSAYPTWHSMLVR